ncbi:adhesion G protein-coupled receptor F5 isoform X2 [Phodopus roborovskii]|uniref:Adhesion G protein-coupled receptor F5 n=1 Tax=Phodopus roborovskii TaxID=109678 RepID=A0AAV0A6K9_PHORO|nr:adhesion G protein-coupled receptor F5 isoform X2 [Phodopus roborovskii]CAH7219836.1 Adgrf5 [Phodopus roborovskii]
MKAPRTVAFCLVLIVMCSPEATWSTTVQPIVHPLILHEHELAGEEPVRQKRAAAVGGPVEEEYTVDIEISFENISFLESVKAHLNSLSFPLQGNSTDPTSDIVSIAVTTVCTPAGNDLLCSCEKGYVWPRERCLHSLTCQEHDGALSGHSCSCLKGLPPQGPFCQLPDAYITLKIKVRLNIGFQEDLKNSSSALYRSYKTDLERAFREGYKILPGFRSVTVTQFTKGSVVVNYEVQLKSAPLPGSIHKAHEQVTQNLNQTYRMDYNSFQGMPSNETKFTVTPEVIFEGDRVILECETEILHANASWYHGEKRFETQNGSRFSIHTSTLNNMSLVSSLTIYNFTKQDAGEYRCKLTLDIFEYGDAKKLDVTPIRILAKEERKVVCDSNPISLNCCSENVANWSSIEWKQEGKIRIVGVPETDLDSSCSTYTLKADGTQCPSGSSGTTVTYTCEFVSPYGARGSKNIAVTFISIGDNSSYKGEVSESLRHVMEVSTVQSTTRNSLETSKAQEQQANLTITPDPISVSEGQSFSITCLSDVSNYDEVYWNISAGIKIHPRFYTMRSYQGGAESVLTVKTSTKEWNGTYHCIFRYKNSYSIATKDVTVHPLPLESDIMMDPLEASGLWSSPHQFKCCVEEERGQEYIVTFHVDSSYFPAEREVNGKQACYKYSLPPNFLSRCPKSINVFCHFTNAVNTSVRSPSMKLTLVPGENITCRDPVIGIGEPGKVIQKLCQFSSVARSPGQIIGGIITYKCVGSQWKEEKRGCISAPINGLLKLAKALIKSPSQDQKLPAFLRDLSVSAGKEEQDIRSSPGSLGAIISILDLLSTVPTQVNSEMMRDVLATINVILDKSTLNSWEKLLEQQSNQSSQFLHSVERFTKVLQLGGKTPPSFFHPNVQMKSMIIKHGHPQVYQQKFVFPDSDLWGDVAIDECQLGNLQPDSFIVTMAFPTLKAILGKDAQKKTPSHSLVMTTTVSHSIIKPFRISMTFKNNHPSGGKPQCVFWNFSLDSYTGGWDSSGCSMEDDGRDSRDRVFCKCNHLTSFSILMSPDSPDSESLLKVLLDIITYIGLGFSIFSLAACIVVETMVWKSVTKNRTSYMRHICIVNIALCLLLADIWFIVASAIHNGHYPLNKTACVAATFFIHFFYLSVFFWMLTLGLMLFYRLIFILHDASKSTQKAIAFTVGYGCPLIISSITVGVTQPQEVYMRKNACWLNWEDTRALLAFAIPALIIVVVNVSITVVVITKILRPSIGDKPGKQEKSSLFQISKSIGVLTPLLGLTWGFGLATVIQGSNAVFHIIFTLLNAFQGLFILLFGCLWDQKVQEALLHKFSLSRWSSQHSKSTSLGSATPVFSMSSPISRRFNNLFGKTATPKVPPSNDGNPVSSGSSSS